jgi:hypothetical protein
MAISVKNQKAPVLNKTVDGINKYCWRICPYSTADGTDRIPDVEQTIHYTTSGRMSLAVTEGHGQVGFICRDPNCSYYLGTASTAINIDVRVPSITVSGEYIITASSVPIPMCSGHWFFEY